MPAENKQADTVALTPSLPVVISVFCFIINIFKQNGPRSEPTEHISLSGSKWFDPQRVFMKLFFENKKSADDNKSITKHAVLLYYGYLIYLFCPLQCDELVRRGIP